MIVSWCVNLGKRRCVPLPEAGCAMSIREGWIAVSEAACAACDVRKPSDKLFSATICSDFSNTFHSLMVLSVERHYPRQHCVPHSTSVHRLTICAQEEVCSILSPTPLDLVDLLFNL